MISRFSQVHTPQWRRQIDVIQSKLARKSRVVASRCRETPHDESVLTELLDPFIETILRVQNSFGSKQAQ